MTQIKVGLSVVVFMCALSARAYPQSCYIGGQSCTAVDPGGHFILVPPVPVNTPTANCNNGCDCWSAKSNACASPNAHNEICITCTRAGQPIDLSTGNTFITQTDISLPGLGGGLVLTRTWNSKLPDIQNSFSGMFGMTWRSNLEERLILVSSDGYLKRSMNDGSVWSFGVATVGSQLTYRTAAPANDATNITTGDTVYTLVAKSGEKKLFDNTTGSLLSIVDRNGNATQLTYDSAGRLVMVTDPASRHLYFSYQDSSSRLVTTVTTDFGISLSYTYDAQGRLTRVTKPDSTTVSFDYDAQSKIAAVRDSEGKVLESHTYDTDGRGLTSSRANGVESVTVTYQQ
jgi:YD repeat-containing protein